MTTVQRRELPIVINNYRLNDGRIHVRDKTNGLAVAALCPEKNSGSSIATRILVNGKKLIVPTCSDPKAYESVFTGSVKITFKLTADGILKITEIDEDDDRTVIYVDTKKPVDDIAFDTFPYIPKELTLAEATLKMANLPESFKPDVAVYNRHGVAVFGIEERGYAFYYANPYETHVKQIDALADRQRGGGLTFAKSRDGFVNFKHIYKGEQKYILNAETAQPIELNK